MWLMQQLLSTRSKKSEPQKERNITRYFDRVIMSIESSFWSTKNVTIVYATPRNVLSLNGCIHTCRKSAFFSEFVTEKTEKHIPKGHEGTIRSGWRGLRICFSPLLLHVLENMTRITVEICREEHSREKCDDKRLVKAISRYEIAHPIGSFRYDSISLHENLTHPVAITKTNISAQLTF